MDLVKVIREVQRKKAERKRSVDQAFCFFCREQVPLLSFQQATELDGVSRQRITELAESGLIHRIHNSRGEVLICQNSLLEAETDWQKTLPLSPEFLKSLEPVQSQLPKLRERLA